MHLTTESQNMRQKVIELKVEIDKIIVEDFNTPLSVLGRSNKQKISKDRYLYLI